MTIKCSVETSDGVIKLESLHPCRHGTIFSKDMALRKWKTTPLPKPANVAHLNRPHMFIMPFTYRIEPNYALNYKVEDITGGELEVKSDFSPEAVKKAFFRQWNRGMTRFFSAFVYRVLKGMGLDTNVPSKEFEELYDTETPNKKALTPKQMADISSLGGISTEDLEKADTDKKFKEQLIEGIVNSGRAKQLDNNGKYLFGPLFKSKATSKYSESQITWIQSNIDADQAWDYFRQNNVAFKRFEEGYSAQNQPVKEGLIHFVWEVEFNQLRPKMAGFAVVQAKDKEGDQKIFLKVWKTVYMACFSKGNVLKKIYNLYISCYDSLIERMSPSTSGGTNIGDLLSRMASRVADREDSRWNQN